MDTGFVPERREDGTTCRSLSWMETMRKVMVSRLGLCDEKRRTLEEVARRHKVTREESDRRKANAFRVGVASDFAKRPVTRWTGKEG